MSVAADPIAECDRADSAFRAVAKFITGTACHFRIQILRGLHPVFAPGFAALRDFLRPTRVEFARRCRRWCTPSTRVDMVGLPTRRSRRLGPLLKDFTMRQRHEARID
jgi:hypothetical protein